MNAPETQKPDVLLSIKDMANDLGIRLVHVGTEDEFEAMAIRSQRRDLLLAQAKAALEMLVSCAKPKHGGDHKPLSSVLEAMTTVLDLLTEATALNNSENQND